ncbi:23S rRNA (uracil(1939)-C(5))-methyltransferase RlmD [Pseudaeromonas sharmana]|uniref:23S rRNA (uracil(1939)-C(5))-methyltransferase RlmD n=1 Tax=Pseudaeromonas sharmana TaxID=328412 RepID=A0ABV8CMF8_9GAMM
MAQFFKPQPKTPTRITLEVQVDSLDLHGVGVGRHQGKALFIDGAMPGERVKVRLEDDKKKQHAQAQLLSVLTPSNERQAPICPHYADCGGCSTQHLPAQMQISCKVAGVQQLFRRLAATEIGEPEACVTGPAQGYRRVCRLAIKYDKKARLARLGFRRRQSHELVEVAGCPVLEPALSALITPLRVLCNQLTSFRDLGHVELCAADNGTVLLVRHNGQPPAGDLERLCEFATQHRLQAYLQTDAGPVALQDGALTPGYRIDEQWIRFLPGDFLQVNRTINEQMVATVLQWLAPKADDKVLDLFCGLGNFTLPLGRRAGEVVGIEGVREMVLRARQNAADNGVERARFFQCNLDEPFHDMPWAREPFSLVLLDPARPGAAGVMPHLMRLAPKRLVYVSCNPVTAARDCKLLFSAGYQLVRWSLFDMFPQTGHVETILLFEKV